MTETTAMRPAATDSYETTRFNALRHGVLSRYTVLPWEDQDEYCRLLDALVAEHKPKGPTEEHIVEEMTGVLYTAGGLKSAVSSGQQTIKAVLVHLDIEEQTARQYDDGAGRPR